MKNLKLSAMLSLSHVLPKVAAALGQSPEMVLELENQIEAYKPILSEVVRSLDQADELSRRKARYRHLREDASMVAFRTLMAQGAPSILEVNADQAKQIAAQSIKLGEAFADAWLTELERLEQEEEEALDALASFGQEASNGAGAAQGAVS